MLVALMFLVGCAPMTDTSNPPGLDGTDWTLTSMSGKAPVGGSITLKFEQGNASGSAGCNQYNGAYTTSGSTIELGPIAATKRACLEQALNVQETAYLNALSKVAKYDVSGDRLMLRDAGGTTLLEFERAR
jgi:Heat shock protein